MSDTMAQRPRMNFHAVETRVLGLEEDVRALDLKVEKGMAGIRTDFAAAIASIHTKLDQQGQPKWGVIYAGIGVLITFMTVIGGLAYWPIRESQGDLRIALREQRKELKEEQQENMKALIQRDQRLWDAVLDARRAVDRLGGALNR